MTQFRALFPSRYESVGDARRAVASFAEQCGLDRADLSDIVLAVGEACNNAAEHGHVDSGNFTVDAVFDGVLLSVEVRDDGGGFDPQSAVASFAALDFIGRGRGIPIMRALMDSVTYSASGSGTTVILQKRVSAHGLRESSGKFSGLDARRAR